jgi:hypothetical protein
LKEYTLYFHPSGIYRIEGAVRGVLVSRTIQDYIDGIIASNYENIVGWKVGEDIYRCYVGDITNSDTNIDLNKVFFEYDLALQTFSPCTYPFDVRCTTKYIESEAENVYLGTGSDNVYQDNVGNNDGGDPIEWRAETPWIFPFGVGIEGRMSRVQAFTRDGRGMKIGFKLYGIPTGISETWEDLGDIEDYVQELPFSSRSQLAARGIKFLFSESSENKPPTVEKIIIFVKPNTVRTVKREQ